MPCDCMLRVSCYGLLCVVRWRTCLCVVVVVDSWLLVFVACRWLVCLFVGSCLLVVRCSLFVCVLLWFVFLCLFVCWLVADWLVGFLLGGYGLIACGSTECGLTA